MLVWYDKNNKAVAFGAEAQLYTVKEEAEDHGWVLAEYFNCNQHPSDIKGDYILKMNELPPGLTLRQINSDFLGYLLKHTKEFFERRVLGGKMMWERYSSTAEIVIVHPDGWEAREQASLRSATITAGLSTIDRASSKIQFLTQTKALTFFYVYRTNLGDKLQVGSLCIFTSL
ncbi:unnamed protein product [Rhizoctonia solani]|uniref:Uncharacterized protein n=1 Tax=Rhizoctonia solani TaxID=456999 RepID=A0A8H2W9E5_9AGAM|nr:unnamed protein product [Rhizoctonia solani]